MTPVRLTSTTRRQSSSESSCVAPPIAMPALLIQRSTSSVASAATCARCLAAEHADRACGVGGGALVEVSAHDAHAAASEHECERGADAGTRACDHGGLHQ